MFQLQVFGPEGCPVEVSTKLIGVLIRIVDVGVPLKLALMKAGSTLTRLGLASVFIVPVESVIVRETLKSPGVL